MENKEEEKMEGLGVKKHEFKSRTMKFLQKYFPWVVRWLLFLFSRYSMRDVSRLHEEFSKSEEIDIFPSSGPKRGFVMVIDRKKALYFYQDGDHFFYDGCEVGEYEKGDVTIFDDIKDDF